VETAASYRTYSVTVGSAAEAADLAGRFNPESPVEGPMRSARAEVIARGIAGVRSLDTGVTVHIPEPITPIDPIGMHPLWNEAQHRVFINTRISDEVVLPIFKYCDTEVAQAEQERKLA
jgi:hypothetical protein